MKKIAILGSTGSIGSTLIKVIKKDKKNFKIELITANKNYKKIITQVKFFKIKNVIITDQSSFLKVKKFFRNKKINIYNNFDSLNVIFKNRKIDYAMCSITGFYGLKPTLDIIRFSKVVAIANKESIICGRNPIKKNLNKVKWKTSLNIVQNLKDESQIDTLQDKELEKNYVDNTNLTEIDDIEMKKIQTIYYVIIGVSGVIIYSFINA